MTRATLAAAAALAALALPAPASAARLIAFASDRDGDSEIYLVRADGTDLHRLTRNRTSDREPAWSPEGRRIAFVSDRDGDDEIFVMRPGGGVRQVTRNGSADVLPAWSPDGRRIVFASTRRGGQLDIYVINADGSDRQRLTTSRATDYGPSWSPDGSLIAFASNRVDLEGNHEIFVMNSDGTEKRRLTFTGGSFEFPQHDTFPSWSPDGSTILFSSAREVSEDLWSMDADGSDQVALQRSPASDEFQASYAPSGRRLLYTRLAPGRSTRIWIANADGSEARLLTRGSSASWRPFLRR